MSVNNLSWFSGLCPKMDHFDHKRTQKPHPLFDVVLWVKMKYMQLSNGTTFEKP